jgi:GTPase Era involved in 16S rRNA processing
MMRNSNGGVMVIGTVRIGKSTVMNRVFGKEHFEAKE